MTICILYTDSQSPHYDDYNGGSRGGGAENANGEDEEEHCSGRKKNWNTFKKKMKNIFVILVKFARQWVGAQSNSPKTDMSKHLRVGEI